MQTNLLKNLMPEANFNLPAYTTAIQKGAMLQWDSNTLLPMAAEDDDALFCGISDSVAAATVDSGKNMLVMPKCICLVTVASGTFRFGAGVKWASATTVAADNANGIGWIVNDDSSARISVKVLFDVFRLGKLFDVVA